MFRRNLARSFFIRIRPAVCLRCSFSHGNAGLTYICRGSVHIFFIDHFVSTSVISGLLSFWLCSLMSSSLISLFGGHKELKIDSRMRDNVAKYTILRSFCTASRLSEYFVSRAVNVDLYPSAL